MSAQRAAARLPGQLAPQQPPTWIKPPPRPKPPTPRQARVAVDTLAQLGPDVLAAMIEAAIDRLDAVQDTDADHDGAEDPLLMGQRSHLGLGDADDAEVDDEDCCEAADDDPALSVPFVAHGTTRHQAYLDADYEPTDGNEGGNGNCLCPAPGHGLPISPWCSEVRL